MSPEKQRIAIAEACGWKIETKEFQTQEGVRHGVRWTHPVHGPSYDGLSLYGMGFKKKAYSRDLPDYLNDLNEMHEAELTAGEKDAGFWLRYLDAGVGHLPDVVSEANPRDPVECATAAQRAEALLRAIGKWEGGTNV